MCSSLLRFEKRGVLIANFLKELLRILPFKCNSRIDPTIATFAA